MNFNNRKMNLFKIFALLILAMVFIYTYSINKREKYEGVLEIKNNVPLIHSLEAFPKAKQLSFRIYLKTRNGGKNIKAGYYELKGNLSLREIVNILESGTSKVTKITIPEGYSYKNIIKILVKDGRWKEEKIEEALKKRAFPYPTPEGNYEGYFYPETYLIPDNYNEEQVVNVILNYFLKMFPSENYPDKKDFYQKLIMASIIEREAMISDEKPRIASVFYNRIDKGMRLASDATVNFLYDYSKKRIYYKHLEIDSPYNTYKNVGLPPAPIASPDKKSVEAAYNPEKTDYLFFVAVGDGSHHFTRTYKEHLEFQKQNEKNKLEEKNKLDEKNKEK